MGVFASDNPTHQVDYTPTVFSNPVKIRGHAMVHELGRKKFSMYTAIQPKKQVGIDPSFHRHSVGLQNPSASTMLVEVADVLKLLRQLLNQMLNCQLRKWIQPVRHGQVVKVKHHPRCTLFMLVKRLVRTANVLVSFDRQPTD